MRCLLFGATGFLGRNLINTWPTSDMDWVGLSRNHASAASIHPLVEWDALDAWPDLLPGVDAVVHAMAITDLGACEQDEPEAVRVNGLQPIQVADACRSLGIPFLYFSTDGIFGDQGDPVRLWTTEDRPHPVNAYGRSKVMAEQGISSLGWGQVIRCSFVGPSQGTRRGLISFLAGSIRAGLKEVAGFGDRYFSPISTIDLCRRMKSMLSTGPVGYGLHHWASAPALTKAEFLAGVLAEVGSDLVVRVEYGAPMPGGYPVPEIQSLACPDPQPLIRLLEDGAQALREELA